MELNEILKTKLSSIYKQHAKLEKTIKKDEGMYETLNAKRKLLAEVLDTKEKVKDFRNLDTSKVSFLLVSAGHFDNMELLENNLREVKVILKAIHDRKLVTSLTNNQMELLNTYYLACKKLHDSISKKCEDLENECFDLYQTKDELETRILEIEVLLEKINNSLDESVLDKDDYDLIIELSKDTAINVDVRKNLLTKFIEYNEDRKLGKKKHYKMDIDALKELFSKYGVKDSISRKIDKYKNAVEENGNLKNAESILIFLKENGILDRFDVVNLLTICTFGSVDSVRREYEIVKDKEDSFIQYDTPSAWIDNSSRFQTKRRTYSKRKEGDSERDPLTELAHMVSSRELEDNIAFLKKEGFTFESQEGSAKKTLYMPSYKLVENVNALKAYGVVTKENVKDFKIWQIAESNLIDKLDKTVELGLLNGPEERYSMSNYIKRYPSKLHNLEYDVYAVLYREKQVGTLEGYYDRIESKKSGQLSGFVTIDKCGFKTSTNEELDAFIDDNFVRPESYIECYDIYDQILSNTYNMGVNPNIMSDPDIVNLESNYKVNDYLYDIDGVYISRLKTLRNYSLLRNIGNDGLLVSMVRNSFLTEESLDKIKKSIGYALGGNDGLSRTV